MDDDDDAVMVLPVHHCLDLLRGGRVGRLAISRPGAPDVFPVNYVIDQGTIVFRTAPGTKLDATTSELDVTFEVDGFDPVAGDAWSVIAKGRAAPVDGLHERLAVIELPLVSWQPTATPHFVRMEPVEMTGRRFRARLANGRRAEAPPRGRDE